MSCKENEAGNSDKDNQDKKVEKSKSENLTSEVPSFSNSTVQDYVNSYEEYLDEYAKAVDSKDIEALSDLGPKGQELALKAQEISGNMSVEDAQKFTHYMAEKAKTIQELTLKIAD